MYTKLFLYVYKKIIMSKLFLHDKCLIQIAPGKYVYVCQLIIITILYKIILNFYIKGKQKCLTNFYDFGFYQ